MKKIIIGSDHGGFDLKEILKSELATMNIDVTDVGCPSKESVHYPEIGESVARGILSGKYERGILICGTGIGMSIIANRFNGIRATLCSDNLTAKLSREHNNSNILVLGGRLLGDIKAIDIMQTWLETDFQGARHQDRLNMIDACNLK